MIRKGVYKAFTVADYLIIFSISIYNPIVDYCISLIRITFSGIAIRNNEFKSKSFKISNNLLKFIAIWFDVQVSVHDYRCSSISLLYCKENCFKVGEILLNIELIKMKAYYNNFPAIVVPNFTYYESIILQFWK